MNTNTLETAQAISSLLNQREGAVQDSLKLAGVEVEGVELQQWKDTLADAARGDQAALRSIDEYLPSDEATPAPTTNALDLFGAKHQSQRNINKFYWGWHTKNKWPICPVQRLWISHDILAKASSVAELASLVATATKNDKAAAAVAALMIAILVIKSFDHGKGVLIEWMPGPLIPGPSVIPPTVKSQ